MTGKAAKSVSSSSATHSGSGTTVTTAKSAPHAEFRWWILFTVIIGTFLGRLDQTIVNLATPDIISGFGITVSAAGWISTAYILANAVFVPIWGKLGDTVGRKRVYILGFSIFIVGSILCGLAWNLGSLIFFRIIQAIASSADYPTAMAIIAITFHEEKARSQALGIWSASFAAASVFGPLLGGPLIDIFGWRSVFLINLPIGLVGLLLAMVFIDESKSAKKTVRFDWWGAVTLGVCLSALNLVLEKGIDWGWFSLSSIACYVAVLAFFAWFVHIEHHHPEPLVDLKFFKNSIFIWTLVNNFLIFMALMGAIFLIPLFAQIYLGYTATQSGYIFIPMAFGMVLAAAIGSRLWTNTRVAVFVSTGIAAIGMFTYYFIDVNSTPWDLMYPLVIIAVGMGSGMAQRTNAIAAAVPKHEIGAASSVLALVRNISGAFGIAVFATILNNAVESHVLSLSQHTTIANPAMTGAVIQLIVMRAQILAYREVFIVAGFVLLLATGLALFIKVKRVTETVHAE